MENYRWWPIHQNPVDWNRGESTEAGASDNEHGDKSSFSPVRWIRRNCKSIGKTFAVTSFQFLPGIALRSKQKHLKPCIALHSYNEPAHQERLFAISHIRLHEAVAYWVEEDDDSVYNGKCPFGLPLCFFLHLQCTPNGLFCEAKSTSNRGI